MKTSTAKPIASPNSRSATLDANRIAHSGSSIAESPPVRRKLKPVVVFGIIIAAMVLLALVLYLYPRLLLGDCIYLTFEEVEVEITSYPGTVCLLKCPWTGKITKGSTASIVVEENDDRRIWDNKWNFPDHRSRLGRMKKKGSGASIVIIDDPNREDPLKDRIDLDQIRQQVKVDPGKTYRVDPDSPLEILDYQSPDGRHIRVTLELFVLPKD